MAFGLPISALGLVLRGWAAGHLQKNERLITGGPYAYIRNPLYLGTLLAAAGIVVASRSGCLAVLFALAFSLVYLPAVELEEQHLRSIFSEYGRYAAEVDRFVPRKKFSNAAGHFSWVVYRRNQEYKAVAGFLVAAVWLAIRCWFSW
jgi:protein-S-isoprenylcysteine O-methyltransferase Ste14